MEERFRPQFSKMGNTWEQLFHAGKALQIDENAETMDVYVQRIRQAATMLDYSIPQIFEVFKNTWPSHLYWVLFPTNNLR